MRSTQRIKNDIVGHSLVTPRLDLECSSILKVETELNLNKNELDPPNPPPKKNAL